MNPKSLFMTVAAIIIILMFALGMLIPGLPANAVISTTIGDSIGYISYTEIGEDAAISGPMATALMAVPVVILIGLAIGSMVLIKMRA